MPGRSSIDQLASAVAAAVEAPAVKTSTSEPSSLSQTIAMRAVDAFAETLVIAALLGELGLVLGNVFARAYFHHSFLWADEVARLSLSILALIAGAVAYRRRDHAFVRVVLNLVPPTKRRMVRPRFWGEADMRRCHSRIAPGAHDPSATSARMFGRNRMRFIHNFPATTLSRMTIGSRSVASPRPDSFATVF